MIEWLSKELQELQKALQDKNAGNTQLQGKISFLHAQTSQALPLLVKLLWSKCNGTRALLNLSYFKKQSNNMDASPFSEEVWATPISEKFFVSSF